MNGLLFLLCCIEILAAVCGAQSNQEHITTNETNNINQVNGNISSTATPKKSTSTDATVSSSLSTQPPEAVTQLNSHPLTTPSPGPRTISSMFLSKECLPVFMVAGGLIIASTLLLVLVLVLACKVCQLSGRIKALSSNADLNSNAKYWMENAKSDEGKSETEPKETTVLMADLNQMQEEMGNGATQEEGAKVNEGGQMGEEKKEEGDAKEASTTPETVAQNTSSSKPLEEAADVKPTQAAAEAAKDEV